MYNYGGIAMNTKIKRIYVDGYKNLVDCETELHDFSVLVGPNNSGKSNFLEIFTFVNALLFGSEENKKYIFEQAGTPRGHSSTCHIEGHQCKPISISFLLEHSEGDICREIEYSLSVQCADPFIGVEATQKNIGFVNELLTIKDKTKTGKPVTLFRRKGNTLEINKEGRFSEKKIDKLTSAFNAIRVLFPDNEGLDPLFPLAISILLDLFYTRVVFISPYEVRKNIDRGKGVVYDPSRTTSLDILSAIAEINKDKSLFSQFKNVLCQVLDIEDANFSSFKLPENVRKEVKEAPEVFHIFKLKMPGQPFSDIRNFSDGTLMVVAILVLLLSPEKDCPLICIEEPENCLHPKALKTLLSYLKQKTIDFQILLTTHSPFLLNQVSPEDVTVAYVKDDGSTHFEQIGNIKELHRKLRKGFFSFGDMLETGFKEEEGVIF
jgi:predicted ATPase